MIESVRNLGRLLVFIGFIVAAFVIDVVLHKDFNQFLFHLFWIGVAGLAVLLVGWIAHDAQAELKSLAVQKQELKGKDEDVQVGATREVQGQDPPWLYP